MKATIDGKRYDTETAEMVAAREGNAYRSDYAWFEETLYRTQKGSWFLAGQGNALSPYSKSYPDGHGPGHKIVPLTAEEAQEWLERRGETLALDTYFKDSIEEA